MALQLASLNLNQLVALDALLGERNVRKAAVRMGVTQSAMSHTLRALRELLGDPLLVRVGNQMVPTQYAEQIAVNLRRGLSELESVVRGRAAFSPESISDEFTLSTHDGVLAYLAPVLYRLLAEQAPRARLRIAALDVRGLRQQLLDGEVDVALVAPLLDLTGLQTEPVMGSGFCGVVRQDHPRIAHELTLDLYCEVPHVMQTITGTGRSFIDDILAQQGREREVTVKVPYMYALPDLLTHSDLIATMPIAAARYFCDKWPLKILELPFHIPAGNMVLCWHERFAADPAAQFFVNVVREATRVVQAQVG